MPRPSRPPRDLSAQAGNPTSEIQKHYSELMAIQDPDELIQAADTLVQPLIGHGFSPNNYKKFTMDLQQAARRGLLGIQSFLSNYMLKGSGLGVAESNEIGAIASLICEDTNSVKLSKRQIELKRLVENVGGFSVALLEYPENPDHLGDRRIKSPQMNDEDYELDMSNIISLTVQFVLDDDMIPVSAGQVSVQKVIEYLEESPRHGVIITDFEEESDECVINRPVFILCGAGESLDDYFYGEAPYDDPDKVVEYDLSARMALHRALDYMTE